MSDKEPIFDDNAVAITTARLEAVLQEAKKDEAILKKILENRRLKRRGVDKEV